MSRAEAGREEHGIPQSFSAIKAVPMNYDALIFDLDGTLWNSADTVAEAWNAALEKAGYDVRITGGDVLKQMGKPMDAIMRDAFGDAMTHEEAMEFLKVLSVEEINHIEKTGGKLVPALEETLAALKKSYRLFIVSNCQKGYIEAFLTAHKLSDYFEGFMCWGDTKLPKAETNKRLIERYSIKNPVYIGDTEGDHVSAEGAGIPFVHAAYGFGEVSGYDYRLEKFSDLIDIFMDKAE